MVRYKFSKASLLSGKRSNNIAFLTSNHRKYYKTCLWNADAAGQHLCKIKARSRCKHYKSVFKNRSGSKLKEHGTTGKVCDKERICEIWEPNHQSKLWPMFKFLLKVGQTLWSRSSGQKSWYQWKCIVHGMYMWIIYAITIANRKFWPFLSSFLS